MSNWDERLREAESRGPKAVRNLWAERFVHDLYEQWEAGNAAGCGEQFDGEPAPVQAAAFAGWLHGQIGVLWDVYRDAYRGHCPDA